jgi:hypothetical protein
VTKRHELSLTDVTHLSRELDAGKYDCLLFSKGRLGAVSQRELLQPDGCALVELLDCIKVPSYMWYVDRVLGYDREREEWMRRVAPYCRVACVSDGPLVQTDWAHWHVLRPGVPANTVCPTHVHERDRQDLVFVGQVYGYRFRELDEVACDFDIALVQDAYGYQLSRTLSGFRVILGPRFPSVDGYWSNRIYLVLGHGGFFLAPEIEGMRDEGFLPGVHYAALGDDPAKDVRYWLDRPEERQTIARQGQQLVLDRHTMRDRVDELCQVIRETLP